MCTSYNGCYIHLLYHCPMVLAQILSDLVLDTPSAPTLLEKFTEQAKVDGCLPADYKPPSPPSDGTEKHLNANASVGQKTRA